MLGLYGEASFNLAVYAYIFIHVGWLQIFKLHYFRVISILSWFRSLASIDCDRDVRIVMIDDAITS